LKAQSSVYLVRLSQTEIWLEKRVCLFSGRNQKPFGTVSIFVSVVGDGVGVAFSVEHYIASLNVDLPLASGSSFFLNLDSVVEFEVGPVAAVAGRGLAVVSQDENDGALGRGHGEEAEGEDGDEFHGGKFREVDSERCGRNV